ncbi:MAG: aminotransferase class I/II-fold pyridoxal phosphate-dependent enzyme [Candidatus Paceibacterota bacterium]
MDTTLELQSRFAEFKSRGFQIDMTRGVPSKEQLALSAPMLRIVETMSGAIDCLNYGSLEGLPVARQFFADYLGTVAAETIIGGNSSLALMHDVVAHAHTLGMPGDDVGLWKGQCAFLCPSPGYDRHHTVCESLGIMMIPIRMTSEGPHMEDVLRHVKNPLVVGIWCTPYYHNPTGETYSDAVVSQLASMKTANGGFRIFWDMAYAVHHLTEQPAQLLDIRAECQKYGNEDRVFQFASTSKITWAGSGICAMSTSPRNLAWFHQWLFAQTIGNDKLNQLRHVLFLKDMDGVRAHMARHRAILRPKFDAVERVLFAEFGRGGAATWTTPRGGYFVTLRLEDSCAKRTVELCAQLGIKATRAGATHPYSRDFEDRTIRLAPTCLSVENVEASTTAVALSAKCAAMELREKRMLF